MPPLLDPDAQVSGEIQRAVRAIERWLARYTWFSVVHAAADEKATRGSAQDKELFELVDAEFAAFLDTYDAVTDRLMEAPASTTEELIAKTAAYARACALYWRPQRDWREMTVEDAIDVLDTARDNSSLACIALAAMSDLSRLGKGGSQ